MTSPERISLDKLKFDTEKVKLFDFPLIDYSLHPAFNFPEENIKLSKQIDVNINYLDKEIKIIIKRLNQKKKISEKLFSNEFKKFNFYIDELIKIIDDLKKTKVNDDYLHLYDHIKNSIIRTKHKVQGEIHFLINEENKFIDDLNTTINFKKYGFFLYKLEQNTIERLTKLLNNEISHLKDSSVVEPGPRKIIGFDHGKKKHKFNQLKKIIKKTILYYDIKKLFPKFDVTGISVEYSYPGSNWYKNCYSDLNIKTSKGAYFHVDYEYDSFKSAIYLSDVNKENGPFSYIPGSNNMRRNEFLFRYFKELDIELKKYFIKKINQNKKHFGLNKYYFRIPFMLDAFRLELSMIPKQLLGTSHFGDDLMTYDKSYEFLLKHELKITSDIANAMTFNGHDGIHRGGLTREGERIVVFISWSKKRNFIVQILIRIKNLILKNIFSKRF
jgi:hypothetical protein